MESLSLARSWMQLDAIHRDFSIHFDLASYGTKYVFRQAYLSHANSTPHLRYSNFSFGRYGGSGNKVRMCLNFISKLLVFSENNIAI